MTDPQITTGDVDLDALSRNYLAWLDGSVRTRLSRRLRRGSPAAEDLSTRGTQLAVQLARQTVGADPTAWGLLSGNGSVSVEGALVRVLVNLAHHESDLRHDEHALTLVEAVGAEGARLWDLMPEVRARTRLGDDALRIEVGERLVGLAARAHLLDTAINWYGPLWDRSGGIELFVPPRLRRQVDDVDAISHRNRPVRLAVSDDKGGLRLCDIVVYNTLRRRGVASAALQDLCLFADAKSKAITGTFDPEGGAAEWLGGFYRRHGFRPAAGEEWMPGTAMIRWPQS